MQEQMKLYKTICKTLKENGLANEELNNYDNFKEYFKKEEFKKIIQEKQKRKQKRYRTKTKFREIYKIASMIPKEKEPKIVFITINPNDTMLKQKEETRVKKMELWLKKHFWYSILNKDFGSKTEREHYHAIALTTEPIEQLFHEDGKPKLSKSRLPLYELKNKDFEEISKSKLEQFEPTLCLVDLSINDTDKTINYLLKLNNHSNKLSTKNRVRIIKNPACELFMLYLGIDNKTKKRKDKLIEKYFFKNASYVTLNKRSVTISDTEEISIQDFIEKYCNEF